MTLAEKCAYVKGLMEGMELSSESNEGKILYKVVELLSDMAEVVGNLQENALTVSDELDEIEEAIDLLENCVYDMEEDDELPFGDDDDDYDYDEDEEYELTCPKCGETVVVDEDTLLEGGMVCPKCGEDLEFEFDEDEVEI